MARKVKSVSFSLPPEIAGKLEERAEAAGISRSSYLTLLLSSALQRPFVLEAAEREYCERGAM